MDSAKEQQYRAALKTAKASIIDLQEQVAALSEPIAVIGMSCLFPGVYPADAESPESFYQFLMDGTDSVIDVPEHRLKEWTSKLPPTERPKGAGVKRAALLHRDVYAFDSAFFGISPAETRMTDPQHLLMLELVQSALWHAGLPPEAKHGGNVGVFCGKTGTDHLFDVLGTGSFSADDPYTLTGNMHSAIAGRVSYFFDWNGPCVSLETACSTALVATLQAVNSLRRGQCELAVAGAVNLLLGPTPSHWLGAMQALAPDGRCKAFGANADGFGRGEGGGVFILQRLSEAQRQGNRIHGLILGGASGSDGKSRNFTSPSSKGQQFVIRQALHDADISPTEVAYVETHGTGTPLGDSIEAESLSAIYGSNAHPLRIGSVKSNVAHLEAAAGMAALIKCVMSVREGNIPMTLHANPVNPLIEPENIGLQVCDASRPWPEGYKRRIAGVSSFGITGCIAHLLVAEPPQEKLKNKNLPQEEIATPDLPAYAQPEVRVLPLSARNDSLLLEQACDTLSRLESGVPFDTLCDAAANARPHDNPALLERLALCATDSEAPELLRSFIGGKRQRNVIKGKREKTAPSHIFLFSGQGSQVSGMGRRLYELFPTFRETLDKCDAIASPQLGLSLKQLLFNEADLLQQTRYTQAAIFSHQAALADLLKSWGIQPSAVLGHSIGEYAAAYAAGMFSLEDGLKLTLKRGELVDGLQTAGGMAAVLGSEEQVQHAIKDFSGVCIAAVNGAETVTIAGEKLALDAALHHLVSLGMEYRPMPVSHAFHCPLVEPILDAFQSTLREVSFHKPTIPFISTCTGGYVEATDIMDWPAYFTRQMREPVRFYQAVMAAREPIFIEIGAGPTLTGFGRQIRQDVQWLFTQNGADDDISQERPLAFAIARLFGLGVTPNFSWLRSQKNRPESAAFPRFLRIRPSSPDGVQKKDNANACESQCDKASPNTETTFEPATNQEANKPLVLPERQTPSEQSLRSVQSVQALLFEQIHTFTAVCEAQQKALHSRLHTAKKDTPANAGLAATNTHSQSCKCVTTPTSKNK